MAAPLWRLKLYILFGILISLIVSIREDIGTVTVEGPSLIAAMKRGQRISTNAGLVKENVVSVVLETGYKSLTLYLG